MTFKTIVEPPLAAGALQGNDQIEIREAQPSDNDGLLELTRSTPMAGNIALRIDRDPNFFALLQTRGEVIAFVATHDGKVIGCMSAAIYEAHVRGVLEKVAHSGDLKVHPDFTGRRLALRLISATEAALRARGIDLSFSLVADGNERPMKISRGEHGTPAHVRLGKFFVDELLPSPLRKKSRRYTVGTADRGDLNAISEMLNDFSRSRLFARTVSLEDLERQCNPSAAGFQAKMFVAREDGSAVATLTVADTQALRRNVLMGLPAGLHAAVTLLRLLALPFGKFRIPRIGQPVATLYVRHMACAKGHEAALGLLVSEARAEAFRRRYTFLTVGLHERDPVRCVVAGTPRLTFISHIMATSLATPSRVTTLTEEIPYEDFALV
jgi:predicted N-acetyltransferase YhbS